MLLVLLVALTYVLLVGWTPVCLLLLVVMDLLLLGVCLCLWVLVVWGGLAVSCEVRGLALLLMLLLSAMGYVVAVRVLLGGACLLTRPVCLAPCLVTQVLGLLLRC